MGGMGVMVRRVCDGLKSFRDFFSTGHGPRELLMEEPTVLGRDGWQGRRREKLDIPGMGVVIMRRDDAKTFASMLDG